jgi:hypothetical protein
MLTNVKDKGFWRATVIRAIKTVCQTAIATIGTATLIEDVNWLVVASASVLAGILSVLTSIVVGLPEVNTNEMSEEE